MSTSKLQRQVSILLSTHLGQHTIRENYHPEWLNGLELDFYIEELNTGIEVQGQQHFEYVPYFHSNYTDYLALKERDARKADLCQHNKTPLHYIECAEDIMPLLEQLGATVQPQQPHANWLKDTLVEYEPRGPWRGIRKKAKDDQEFLKWLCKARSQAEKGNIEKARRYARVAVKRAVDRNLTLRNKHYSILESILT